MTVYTHCNHDSSPYRARQTFLDALASCGQRAAFQTLSLRRFLSRLPPVSVTVYPNSALVTREVEVPAGEGTTQVTVTPLPPTTVQSSLYAEGTDGIRVLSTRFRTRPVMEDTRAEVRRLQEEIRQLQQNQDKAESDIKAVQAT